MLAATAASAPVGYLCGLATSTARPAMRAAALLGATAGFCLAYQRSAGECLVCVLLECGLRGGGGLLATTHVSNPLFFPLFLSGRLMGYLPNDREVEKGLKR